ncbi:DUF4034 domain-containing protein [Serratia sp. DD3]|uniref:DUF4034 domain-containing protein n=1 Tax=Serratia sp. DD3 TaxID=1410619 RepID=UPI0004D3E26D|nr:DUF4034 domain-containing protein [Serratia sp. DD3]KEY60660.1 hypothetical protein SRDD_05580 [Serratia sp. DD3]
MEQGNQLEQAMLHMCNHKVEPNTAERQWIIADIASYLADGRYEELDELYTQALVESFTHRQAEKRYFQAWTQMCNPFYDMDTLINAGPNGLALIKNWQLACPHSSHAWLAEAQYWNHYAWLYRSYGWAKETTHAMWLCTSACNEQMVIAALNAINCDPRQWMVASLTATNSEVFGQPKWLVAFLQGKEMTGQRLMKELAQYHKSSPQEVDALMAHSGLSFENAVCPQLPRPAELPNGLDNTGQQYWLSVCLNIFPNAFYPLTEYIPFRMPRWRGTHEEIRKLIDSLRHRLSKQECEHLELFIWWDEYRDLRIAEIDSPTEREQTIARAKAIALHGRNQEDRHNAIGWLLTCYDDLKDDDALWHSIQLAVMEEMKLSHYFTYRALGFAQRDFPNTHWIYNFICQNSQQTVFPRVEIYRGYFQFVGLFGFEKNEEMAKSWLDKGSVNSINASPDWAWTIRSLGWLNLHEHCISLAELGAQRNIPGAFRWLALEYGDSDDTTLLPYQPITALNYNQRTANLLHEQIARRDNIAYPLISNGGYTEYEDDLRDIHFSMAASCQKLSQTETDLTLRDGYEKDLLDNLYQAHLFGHQTAWGLFLLNIFEVKNLELAHSHLDLLHEEAEKGTLEAMVSLSRLYGNKLDNKLYSMKKSVRWAYFARRLFPDSEVVEDCLYPLHGSSRWKRYRFAWLATRISDTELPGQVNSMV